MINPRFLWILLPYTLVFAGMLLFRSAWGALVWFHLGMMPVLLPRWRMIRTALKTPPVPGKIILPVALSGASAGLGLWVLWPTLGIPAGFKDYVGMLGLSGWIWVPFIMYFTLINPILEEAYWRLAYGSSTRYFSIIDFMFAGYHLIILSLFIDRIWMVFAFCVLVCASWFWRQVSRYSGSLIPAVAGHMLADFSLLLVVRYFAA